MICADMLIDMIAVTGINDLFDMTRIIHLSEADDLSFGLYNISFCM